MDEVLRALERLECARAQLHDALRHAAFALVVAQRAAEARGGLVDYAVLPDASVQPKHALVWLSTVHSNDDNNDNNDDDNDNDDNALATVQSWTMHFADGVAPTSSRTTHDDGDGHVIVDPLYAFGALPSRELRACRQHYRAVLQCVLTTAQAQAAALAATAAACACACDAPV